MADTAVDQLTEDQAREEFTRLTAALAHHDALYYSHDAPEISDAEYDALKRRALEIESRFPELTMADSPSQVVGAAVSSQFAEVRHRKRPAAPRRAPVLEFDSGARERQPARRSLSGTARLRDAAEGRSRRDPAGRVIERLHR